MCGDEHVYLVDCSMKSSKRSKLAQMAGMEEAGGGGEITHALHTVGKLALAGALKTEASSTGGGCPW